MFQICLSKENKCFKIDYILIINYKVTNITKNLDYIDKQVYIYKEVYF